MNQFHPSLFETQKGIENIISTNSVIPNTDSNPLKFNQDIKGNNLQAALRNYHNESPLAFAFFSSKNILNIQNVIKFLVYKHTNHSIDDQSNNELLSIMRSVYVDNHIHPAVINENMSLSQKNKLIIQYKSEIQRLNDIVINSIVPKIVSQLQQYIDYLRDSTTIRINDRPEFATIKGEREYRSITEVLIGSNL
jgi:hypothetical protein